MNLDLVYGIAHHIYELGDDKIWDWKDPGPDSFVGEMQAAAAIGRGAGKPLFQTEFGTEGGSSGEGGFETALLIHHSLVAEGVAAFLYWDLIWVNGSGLVTMDGRPKIRDQYYSVRHYARFTDPGDVRVGAKSDSLAIRASAFLSPSGDRLTAVLINAGEGPAEVRIDSGSFQAASSAIYRTIYRVPTGSETWAELGSLPESRVVALPARSIATVLLTSTSFQATSAH
jgi:O-glycosyl hydrolase